MLKTYRRPMTTPRECVARASPERFQFAAEQIERWAAFPFPSADRRPRNAQHGDLRGANWCAAFCAIGLWMHSMRNLYERGDRGTLWRSGGASKASFRFIPAFEKGGGKPKAVRLEVRF